MKTDLYETLTELYKPVIPFWSVPKLHSVDQLEVNRIWEDGTEAEEFSLFEALLSNN
jgi:hypothetical protein